MSVDVRVYGLSGAICHTFAEIGWNGFNLKEEIERTTEGQYEAKKIKLLVGHVELRNSTLLSDVVLDADRCVEVSLLRAALYDGRFLVSFLGSPFQRSVEFVECGSTAHTEHGSCHIEWDADNPRKCKFRVGHSASGDTHSATEKDEVEEVYTILFNSDLPQDGFTGSCAKYFGRWYASTQSVVGTHVSSQDDSIDAPEQEWQAEESVPQNVSLCMKGRLDPQVEARSRSTNRCPLVGRIAAFCSSSGLEKLVTFGQKSSSQPHQHASASVSVEKRILSL